MNRNNIMDKIIDRGEIDCYSLSRITGFGLSASRKMIKNLRDAGLLEIDRKDFQLPIYKPTGKYQAKETFGDVIKVKDLAQYSSDLSKATTITRFDNPVAVIVPYDEYLRLSKLQKAKTPI